MRARRVVAVAAAGAALVVSLAAGCGPSTHTEAGEVSRGKQLFNEKCASCHVLEAAGAKGTIGPNLDEAFAGPKAEGFDESTIRDVVRGQIAYPVEQTPTGEPGMPANLVRGDDAAAVAAYVASVAANKEAIAQAKAGGGGGGGGGDDPKSIFAASCGGCHTFEKAGTTGTAGPDLDETKTEFREAIEQIRKGGGGMPAFEGQLTDEQIQALATFVAGGPGS